jgi:hypothetical protein
MRVNLGGILAPEDVIGREDLAKYIWQVLQTQSVVLTSERRIGKTSLIRKMVEFAPDERVCFLRDVEGFRSPAEFIESIYADAQPILSKKDRVRLGLWRFLESVGGSEIRDLKLPKFKRHWKNFLSALFDDIFSEETRTVIFFWDELPLFLYNVETCAGGQDAMELLDALRSLRQRYSNLRMVFTGSVGIHQVIGSLRKHGYANDPTNDMATIEVPPVDPLNGALLANLLLEGEGVNVVGDRSEVSKRMSEAAGHIPYYIHYLISRICNSTRRIEAKAVQGCLEDLIADPNDPAHFGYYQSRLTTYYGATEAELALHALDALASADRPLSFAELQNLVKHKTPSVENEAFRGVLQLLLKDHYLARNADATYRFRYSIVETWWAYTRG